VSALGALGATAAAVAILAGWATVATAPAGAVTQTPAFSTTPLNVVGGPVAAEGAAVVVTADSSHDLHVESVAPDSGRVLWSHPYSMSAIPGLVPTLYVVDNDIVDLVPVDRPNDALVDVEGVNATTGTVIWHGPQHILVSDVPSPCEQKKYFCVLGFNGNASTAMAILNPATGTSVGLLQGPATALDLDLYLTDARTPTLEALSPTGAVAWTKTIDQLFGGAGYNPLNGWDFVSFGGTEIGTAGATNADHSNDLDDAKTIGASLATGATQWSLPGQFRCGGTLAFITPPFDCVFTGTVAKTQRAVFPQSFKGLHLSPQGYDAATGTVTWTQPVVNVDVLGNGDASFLDATHLAVQLPSGKQVLLDTKSGKTSTPPPHETLWCSTNGLFKVDGEKDLNSVEMRTQGTRFSPCTTARKPTSTIPATAPSTVGSRSTASSCGRLRTDCPGTSSEPPGASPDICAPP
jgi:hypothetical protein